MMSRKNFPCIDLFPVPTYVDLSYVMITKISPRGFSAKPNKFDKQTCEELTEDVTNDLTIKNIAKYVNFLGIKIINGFKDNAKKTCNAVVQDIKMRMIKYYRPVS